jgi:hypothetical protein
MRTPKDEPRETVCNDEKGADPVKIKYNISLGHDGAVWIKPVCLFYQPVKGKWFCACSRGRGFRVMVGKRCLFDRIIRPSIRKELERRLKEGDFPQAIVPHVKSFCRRCLKAEPPSREEVRREWLPVEERPFDNSSWPIGRFYE